MPVLEPGPGLEQVLAPVLAQGQALAPVLAWVLHSPQMVIG